MDKKNFSHSSERGSFAWKPEVFDSEVLERSVAKITTLSFSAKNGKGLVEKLIQSFQEKDIDYATYRVPASEFLTIHALEENGFVLVDGILSFERVLAELPENIESTTRKASLADLEALQRLAMDTFSGTRFYNDPLIKNYQADKIYGEWIKNSIQGSMADAVLIWQEKENLAGFITLKKDEGRILLIAVSKGYQGKGIGKSLMKVAFNQLIEWGLKKSAVETQMTNIPAINFYLNFQYKVIKTYLTFRWSNRKA